MPRLRSFCIKFSKFENFNIKFLTTYTKNDKNGKNGTAVRKYTLNFNLFSESLFTSPDRLDHIGKWNYEQIPVSRA